MAVGGGTDERRNALAVTGASPPAIRAQAAVMSRETIRIDAPCNDTAVGAQLCEFDDLVVGVDAARLIFRMVAAGRLP
jgi:hypothetical protein